MANDQFHLSSGAVCFLWVGLIHGWSDCTEGNECQKEARCDTLISPSLSLPTGTMHLRWHLPKLLLLTFFLPPSCFFLNLFRIFQRCVLDEFIWALYEVFVVMSRPVEHAALPQIPFLSVSIFVSWDTCDGWKSLVCLVSLVSRVS